MTRASSLLRQVVTIDLYCRISKAADGTTTKVEDQEWMGREDIKRLDQQSRATGGPAIRVGRVFRDNSKSAWSRKVVRAEFEELVARLETEESNGVWVRDLDRFTRKPEEGEMLLKMAEKGCRIFSRSGEHDLSTARGRRHFREEMVDAAYESDRISERTRNGKAMKVRRGKSNASYRGFGRPGYLPPREGWEPGEPRTPVSEEQLAAEREEIRSMARKLLTGATMDSLALDLNARGVTTVTGGSWTSVGIRQLLKSPSLAGLVEHKGEVVEGARLPGEAALDLETWDALRMHFAGRRRGRPATAYLLSGLVTCGKCGAVLYGRPRASGTPYPDGSVRREYWCQKQAGNQKSGCGRLTIDQRFADAMVTEATLRRLENPAHADVLKKRAARVQEARDLLRAQITRLEEDQNGLASKTAEWGFAAVEKAMAPVVKKLEELRAQLAELDDPNSPYESSDDVRRDWDAGEVGQRRVMIRRAFPNGIVVRPATSRGRGARGGDRFDWDPAKL